MVQTIIMPKLGQTVETAAIVKWHKREGDKVSQGDILFEVETDKAVLEAESFHDGTLIKILVPENTPVPVLSAVAFVGEPGEPLPAAPPPPPPADKERDQVGADDAGAARTAPPPAVAQDSPQAPAGTGDAAGAGEGAAEPKPEAGGGRMVISPRARAMASTAAIDPAMVKGSGPGGRILERDVRAWMDANDYQSIRATPAAMRLARQNQVHLPAVRGSGEGGRVRVADIERAMDCRPVPMPGIRRIIAARLSESFSTIPHFYVTVTVDMTGLVALRARLKGENVPCCTINDFVLKATVESLDQTPVMNSRTDGRNITWNGDVNLGVAVGLERGLVVPVLQAAQLMELRQLSEQARLLIRQAHENKLTPDQMSGGGFTVSNMGMLDVDQFNAIINPGESGILAVASIRETAGVADGAVVPRQAMKITLSADHRIADGATGAAFVNLIKSKLEDVKSWTDLMLW